MEKELLEAFEAAEKAAQAAAANGGMEDEDRCVDALRRIRKMPITTKHLLATQVGKRIRSLTKHPKPRIQMVATDLFKFWKSVVISENSKEGKKNRSSKDKKLLKSEAKPEKSGIIKIESSSKLAQSKTGMHSKSEDIKVKMLASDKGLVSEKFSRSKTAKIEKTMKGESGSATHERKKKVETIKVERISKEEKKTTIAKKPLISTEPPNPTSMIKRNDPFRDKLREQLLKTFSKVPAEASEDERDEVRNILDEINACDPSRVAVAVESAMLEMLYRPSKAHKTKYRSIMFNLKDSKNTDLRRMVLIGHIKPEELINMTAEEMASDERKLSDKQIKEKRLLKCERPGEPKATTDQFKCGRCEERKCNYFQLETRRADEPLATCLICENCQNRWKLY